MPSSFFTSPGQSSGWSLNSFAVYVKLRVAVVRVHQRPCLVVVRLREVDCVVRVVWIFHLVLTIAVSGIENVGRILIVAFVVASDHTFLVLLKFSTVNG